MKSTKRKENDIYYSSVKLPNGWLGNMAPYPINYMDKIWLTAEALFQALRFDDDQIREVIRSEKSPMSAKMKAKSFSKSMMVEPASIKDVENMKLCIRLKVAQHKEIRAKLIETGSANIYENIGNRKKKRDFFWGAKLINSCWEGENMMGEIWMKIREEIK